LGKGPKGPMVAQETGRGRGAEEKTKKIERGEKKNAQKKFNSVPIVEKKIKTRYGKQGMEVRKVG